MSHVKMIALILNINFELYTQVIGLQITILFSGVGKTSLIGRYIRGNFDNATSSPTIGASFFNCKLNLGDVKIKLHVRL